MLQRLSLSALLAVPALLWLAASGRAEDEIRLDGAARATLRIPAVINGHPAALSLDTGLESGYLLFRHTLPQLGLKPPPTPAVPALTPGIVPWNFAPEAITWNLFGVILDKIHGEVATAPSVINEFGDYVGMVGWPAVRNNIWILDLGEERIGAAARVPAAAKKWSRWRIGADLGILSLVKDPNPGSVPRLIIDTGNGGDGILLTHDRWLAWRAANPRRPTTLSASVMIGEEIHADETARAEKFTLGDVEIRDILVQEQSEGYRNTAPGESAIVLGLAALKRLDVVLDGPGGYAYVRPHPGPLHPLAYNRLGADFLPVDERESAFAAHVLAGTPAAEAGIHNGDLLLTIDGKKFDPRVSFVDDGGGWYEPAGTKFTLGLQRGDSRMTLAVTLRDILGPESGAAVAGKVLTYQKAPVVLRRNDDEFLAAEGNIRGDRGDRTGAIAYFDQAIALNPQFVDAYSNRGAAKIAMGDRTGALADINRALALNPRDGPAYTNRGLLQFAAGKYADAMADFDRAVALDPRDDDNYRNRGLAQMEVHNLAGAIADFDQAIALNPKLVQAYVDRGEARFLQGDASGAIADYSQAIELDPKDADAFQARASAREDQGDHAGSAADYDSAIRLGSKDPDVYKDRGDARDNLGDHAGAIADYGRAIMLNPKDADAYNNRGTAEDAQGDHAYALADYNQAIALNPRDAEAYNNRGTIKAALGDYAHAIADYDQAIALNPKYTAAFGNRGVAEDDAGKYDAAVADFGRYVALDPKNIAGYVSEGTAQMAAGDLAGAADSFRRAIELDPEQTYPRFYLSIALRRLGRKDDTGLEAAVARETNAWAKDVGGYLLGQIPEAQLIALAAREKSDRVAGCRCEAYYYIGMVHLLRQDVAPAHDFFTQCVATRVTSFTEYMFARAELARLART